MSLFLSFSLQSSNDNPGQYEEALEQNNCTDAILGVGRYGTIALDFLREGKSAESAVFSAISDVKRSIPGAELTEISPDLVGITDIAELVGRSRQNIRKLIFADNSRCPPPAHSGNPALWHLYDVLCWLRQKKHYEVSRELIDVAKVSKSLNALRLWSQIDSRMQQQVKAIATFDNSQIPALSV